MISILLAPGANYLTQQWAAGLFPEGLVFTHTRHRCDSVFLFNLLEKSRRGSRGSRWKEYRVTRLPIFSLQSREQFAKRFGLFNLIPLYHTNDPSQPQNDPGRQCMDSSG